MFDTCSSDYDTVARLLQYRAEGAAVDDDENCASSSHVDLANCALLREVVMCDDCGDCGTRAVLETGELPAGDYLLLVEARYE